MKQLEHIQILTKSIKCSWNQAKKMFNLTKDIAEFKPYDGTTCFNIFKSDQCGYKGEETDCDKTFERCKQLGNSRYFPLFELPNVVFECMGIKSNHPVDILIMMAAEKGIKISAETEKELRAICDEPVVFGPVDEITDVKVKGD